jgi:CRP-like cAMP-binding protein
MVAGLAIQLQRPFDVDDWIQFDPEMKHIGKVLEINWRATKVITLDLVEVVVPNATLAKSPITNFTKPTSISRRSLYVQVPAAVPPHRVQEAILEALPGSFGAVREPAPSVVTNAFVDGNVEYWVRFFTDMFDQRDRVDGSARDRIWYALARTGIPLASPNRSIQLHEVSSESLARDEANRVLSHQRALESVEFLRVLSPEQREMLAARGSLRWYVEGEPVVHQGDASTELFIVQSGEVTVQRDAAGGNHGTELARLGPGHFFGEMALMTGEPRNATVRASLPCSLFVIDHASLRDLLARAPDLAEHISRVIAERQAALEAQHVSAADSSANVQERSSQLLGRIRKFFSL